MHRHGCYERYADPEETLKLRSFQLGQFTTQEEHRPKSHQRYLQWTPSRLIHWAEKVGPCCGKLVEQILRSRPHPEMGFRSVLGIMRLGKGVGEARLEAACRRALHFGACPIEASNRSWTISWISNRWSRNGP